MRIPGTRGGGSVLKAPSAAEGALPRAAVFIFLIGEVIAIRGNIESAQAIFDIKI